MNLVQSSTFRPDFIIIGAMKSATSTLQEQLSQQPGIFMCDPKEPNFFSDDVQYRRGVEWYSSLFSPAFPQDLKGEASTHYTKLPTYGETISRMHALVPNARLVYVMRHPIDRLVSHYIHEWSMGNIHCSINDAVRKFPELIAYGEYSMQLAPYFEMYGRGNILPVFFDRLTREPQSELERVCKFIGYKSVPTWFEELRPSNVSSERLRRFPLYDFVVKSRVATQLRRNLVPSNLRNWVKAKLTMRQRPHLDPMLARDLEYRFNTDLQRLGGWLGREISCENFKAVTGSSVLSWSAQHG